MSKRRVVVTGLGMLSPLGASVETSWEGLTAGHSGIAPIAAFDADSFPVRFGGAVPEFDMSSYLPAKEARRMDGFIQWGLAAGIQAIRHSGLEDSDSDLSRVGVAMGSGIGGINTLSLIHI